MLTDHYGGRGGSMFMPDECETFFADKRTGENTFEWANGEQNTRDTSTVAAKTLSYSVELHFWFDTQNTQIGFAD
jgi:hypothetical protein